MDKAFEENMQLRIAEKTSFLVRKNRATQEITYPLEKPFSSGNASDFTLFPQLKEKVDIPRMLEGVYKKYRISLDGRKQLTDAFGGPVG